MRITTIINGKGGVGKTTTAQALGTGLDKRKYKTLVIDYDPQGNLSLGYGADVENSPTLFHVMNGDIDINDPDLIQHTQQGDIIVGNSSLTKMDALFAGENAFEGPYKLRDALAALTSDYTHIIIDNQPLIGGILTRQTLVATNDIVIPMSADTFTMQGLTKLMQAMEGIIKHANPALSIDGILLARHNQRTILGAHISERLYEWAERMQTRVYKTFIRESVAVREAQAKRQSLFDYSPYSNPAIDYRNFIKEYLAKEEG